MLKYVLAFMLLAGCFKSSGQWVRQQLPLHKKQFEKISAGKITMAFEYETTDGLKALNSVVEYGAMGLPAALYQKGTNDNGDSINTAETIYKFDAGGRLVKESVTDFTEGSNATYIYTYSANGKLTKKHSIHIDPTTTLYTYDGTGKLTKTYTTVRMPKVDENGDATGKAVDLPNERKAFVYDKAGRLREEIVYNLSYEDGGKKWSYKSKWTFNAKNQLEKLELVNSDGKTYSTDKFEYNKEGLLIKKSSQLDDEPLRTFEYEYCTNCRQSWMK